MVTAMARRKAGARVVMDSISAQGHRVTSMEITFWRMVLAEVNTHCVFARNSASSRAIPVKVQLERVKTDPFIPDLWPLNQSGMQPGGYETDPQKIMDNQIDWLEGRDQMVLLSTSLAARGVHKQIANRPLELYMWHTALITATEWDGFFEQRASPVCGACGGNGVELNMNLPTACLRCTGTGKLESMAQREFTLAADAIRDAISASVPVQRTIHMPYVLDYEIQSGIFSQTELMQLSVARCAQLSYHSPEGNIDVTKDFLRYARLRDANPPHRSPFEHVAVAKPVDGGMDHLTGKFRGWAHYRHMVYGVGK